MREDASGKALRIETVEAPAVSGISLAYVEFGDFASMEIETLLWEIEPIIVSYILTFAAFIAAVTSCFAKERETRKSLLSSAFLVFIIPKAFSQANVKFIYKSPDLYKISNCFLIPGPKLTGI